MLAPTGQAVVVTGLGCVSPIGNDVPTFWEALLSGASGASVITSFDTSRYRTHVGCEVKDLEGLRAARTMCLRSKDSPQGDGPRHGRATELATLAAIEALEQAGIDPTSEGRRLGVSLGTTMGESNFLDQLTPAEETAREAGTREDPSRWKEVLTRSAWSITSGVAAQLGVRGIQASLPAACSAGNYAVGLAFDLIRQGKIEVALAGGAEAFSESAFAGFHRLNAMSPDVCRPFDRDRRGLLLGEGAGVLVLESEKRARKRSAPILAEVLGYGLSCDAHHITGPHPDGAGAAAAMRHALRDAGASADDVGWVCCHGTGTLQNDKIEARAIHHVFADRARSLPVSSIKALTGHMMGAASAVEAIACVRALHHSVLPPTWNQVHLDPECDLDVIPNAPREVHTRIVLNNSYAFGGNNACVAFTGRSE